jgi:hypothetical protein
MRSVQLVPSPAVLVLVVAVVVVEEGQAVGQASCSASCWERCT